MTTATKPLPPHGERACYLRGCRRPECLNAHYRYMSRYRLDRHRGQPRRINSTQTRAHIERLLAAGWTQAQIARSASVEHRVIAAVIRGQATVAKKTALGVLSTPIGPPPADDRDVDATGTVRRIRALIAIGYPGAHIADAIGMWHDALNKIARGEKRSVRATTAATVARTYRKLSRTPGPSTRARTQAARNGWAPPAAWDDDAIDDPNAAPDWTGHCGTDRGWWMHKQQQLPMCQRCETAHAHWLAERRHLPQGERFRALGVARGQASNRGAALAEDARELMRVTGMDVELAAERLGVTTSHLHQELGRHPEPAQAAA